MRTNPHPDKVRSVLRRQGSVMEPNTGRPHLANFLKLQRGMVRIGLEQGIVLLRQILDIVWKIGETLPEPTRGSMHLEVPQLSLGFLSYRLCDQEI